MYGDAISQHCVACQLFHCFIWIMQCSCAITMLSHIVTRCGHCGTENNYHSVVLGNSAVQCSAVHFSAVHCSAAQCITVLCSALRWTSAVPCSCSTMCYSREEGEGGAFHTMKGIRNRIEFEYIPSIISHLRFMQAQPKMLAWWTSMKAKINWHSRVENQLSSS